MLAFGLEKVGLVIHVIIFVVLVLEVKCIFLCIQIQKHSFSFDPIQGVWTKI